MYLRELESEIPYPLDDAVKRRLVVDPTSKPCFIWPGSGHLETFECAHHADAQSPADDQLVFGPLGGCGRPPTDGRILLRHTRDSSTVAGTGTATVES